MTAAMHHSTCCTRSKLVDDIAASAIKAAAAALGVGVGSMYVCVCAATHSHTHYCPVLAVPCLSVCLSFFLLLFPGCVRLFSLSVSCSGT